MRHLTLASLLACGLFAGPLVPPAGAVTVEELFSLKANGLSDDILVALIESDGSVFQLLPDDVVMLFRRGLSEKVILAMIATARRVPPPPQQEMMISPAPMQQTVIHPFQLVNSSPVEVYVPVDVPVTVYTPVIPLNVHRPDRFDRLDRVTPVYWGFGGELRPGSWTPPVQRTPVRDTPPPDRDRRPVDRDTPPPTRRR
jgi:hypothetical protein